MPDEGGVGGLCCVGATCEPSDKATCDRINGDYKPPNIGTSGGCFISQVILDYLADEHAKDPIIGLMVGGTYSLLYDARDQILKKWAIGHKALELYRKHGQEVLELTRKDRELRRHLLFTFLRLAMFSRTLLRYMRTDDEDATSKGRYTLGLHKELVALSYQFDAAGASPDVVNAARSLLNQVEELVDLDFPAFFNKIGVNISPRAGRS